MFMVFVYVFNREYNKFSKWNGLIVYLFMDFLGNGVVCVRFGTKSL